MPLDSTIARLIDQAYARSRGETTEPVPGWQIEVLDFDYLQLELATSEDGELVGVAPGTNEKRDWIRGNLNWKPARIVGTPGVWRQGFQEGGEYIWSRVQRLMVDRGATEIVLGGHSLGGAMTAPAVGYARRDRPDWNVTAVTYGAPKGCSKKAARWINDRVTRYTYGFDGVPWAVAAPWWHHAGTHIALNPKTLRQALEEEGLQLVADHSIGDFAAELQRLGR